MVEMVTTTLKIEEETKRGLDQFREYKSESYDEIIRKLLYITKIAKKSPKLSQDAIRQIEEARARMKKGHFYTEEEVKRILGV